MVGKPWFSAVLTGLRKLRDIRDRGVDKFESLESLMSFNLGSAPDGATITQLMCANVGNTKSCSQWGVKTCAQCHLVKYCSEKCKLHHWSKHRPRCTHPYLSKNWQPAWVVEGREPIFLHPFNSVILYRLSHDMWGNVPAMDCLQIKNNEEQSGAFDDLKLCFPASADIRDMIRTVNSLPHNFTGYCDILLNDTNPILLNRTLVILFILLSSGPSLEEAAEFCTHLLYSAALPGAGAAYVKRCVDFIYGGGGEHEADLSFQRSLDTRGEGKLYSVQPSTGIKRLLEMCQSSYPLATALKGMREITLSPDQLDFREKYYATLKPAHRMSFHRFQETGILVPFAHNTVNFTEPNRFLFTSQGEWLVPEDANPLFGWDVTGVKYSGLKYGVDPDSDILGCLFFHVKHELREFAKRVRDFRIDIHVTSFDAGLLAKGISVGALPAFADATFDRVVAANLADTIGIKTCLTDWAPLLNRENRFSSILMQTSAWQTHWYPNSSVKTQWGPQTIHVLLEKYNRVSGLDVQMKAVFTQGLRSPALLRVFESLDACHDNESIFQEYLDDQDVDRSAAAFDLQQRTTHRVYPKRFGIPVEATHAPKPDLSNDEFYDLFTLGGAQLSMRFLEFEGCSPRYRAISEYNDLCRRLFV